MAVLVLSMALRPALAQTAAAPNRVLELSGGTNGYVELPSNVFNDLTEATIQPLAAKKENKLVVDCPSDIGTMKTDQTKVRQVLFNLISNAAKFTEKGVIMLRVSNETGVMGRSGLHFRREETSERLTSSIVRSPRARP